eukprot:CAMPEP_0176124682 /NCGR_PEP_ID=MMETSP0120_2-20121206/62870_1 /TAXON_ID=160619 /ORGANISM="Kryptoperidinium foliaceum, Strain CCMP 1326" /LENGTH=136 /DNA_ID=CAMNT_0017459473 /DNA_START=246 /DNA_END=652 /DNA_ORIENTATION=+
MGLAPASSVRSTDRPISPSRRRTCLERAEHRTILTDSAVEGASDWDGRESPSQSVLCEQAHAEVSGQLPGLSGDTWVEWLAGSGRGRTGMALRGRRRSRRAPCTEASHEQGRGRKGMQGRHIAERSDARDVESRVS